MDEFIAAVEGKRRLLQPPQAEALSREEYEEMKRNFGDG